MNHEITKLEKLRNQLSIHQYCVTEGIYDNHDLGIKQWNEFI